MLNHRQASAKNPGGKGHMRQDAGSSTIHHWAVWICLYETTASSITRASHHAQGVKVGMLRRASPQRPTMRCLCTLGPRQVCLAVPAMEPAQPQLETTPQKTIRGAARLQPATNPPRYRFPATLHAIAVHQSPRNDTIIMQHAERRELEGWH